MTDVSITQRLQGLLNQLQQGHSSARDDLINVACDRLNHLTRKIFQDFARLKSFEQTEDIAQNAAVRLRQSLEDVTPATVREFFGLAALQIRRELLDLNRKLYGRAPGQAGAGHSAGSGSGDAAGQPAGGQRRVPVQVGLPANRGSTDETEARKDVDGSDMTHDPRRLECWSRFHEAVQNLSEDMREVVELLWYHELSQQEAAEVLKVDESTVKRRWRDAKLKLHSQLEDCVSVLLSK